MEVGSDPVASLCELCSRLDIQGLTHPLRPCRNPLPCSTPPSNHAYGTSVALGSVNEIKSRRLTCGVCRLIAECLDEEPPDLDGECRLRESAQFCSFELPGNIKPRDPSVTHFHLTQASVIFDTSLANQFQGPALPWELRARETLSSHYILNFQAKAISGSKSDDGTISQQTEEGFLSTIGGRYVSTQVDTQLICAWLQQCENTHGEDCFPRLRLLSEGDRDPTLVVDVIRSCLVDTPPQCRYVTLSYVWGRTPVFVHLMENTQDLRRASSLHALPIAATIRDAITLVHAIGERYLWVDSLCIIQDDWKMKDKEIMRMGSIYSRALFTIIAAAGDHANSGLPGVMRGTRKQVQKILKLGNRELLTVIDINNASSRIDNSTWGQRAWTFQERALSNRVLVFSQSQVYWTCRVASHSEERALEAIQDIDQLHVSFPQRSTIDYLPLQSLQPLAYFGCYGGLLSSYRQRRLTYQTDILNAFQGVSEILAALQNDTFLWGLPESLFSYALTWTFTGHSSRNQVTVHFESNGSKETVPIPSWSWAAWSGNDPNNPPFLHAGDGTGVRPTFHFDIVNRKHRLVRINELLWSDQLGDRARAFLKREQPQKIQSPTEQPPLQIGQIRFWTSLVNMRVVRGWRVHGPGALEYTMFPPPSFQPDPNSDHYRSEIVDQDFIVIAVSGPSKLMLLAIDWRGGIAYRQGSAFIEEAQWVQVEGKEWRLITLG